MKKLLLILAPLLITFSALAQGTFMFDAGPRTVYNLFSTASTNTTMDVAFLCGIGEAPLVDSIESSVPTNSDGGFPIQEAWDYILNDPNYQLVTNAANGLLAVASVTSI